jgi:putative Mg2+ transporter-C (MgtC) family protein
VYALKALVAAKVWGYMHFEDLNLILRLLAAVACSSLLGLEREAKGKAAGLRTHVLVGLSAALFVVLADVMIARAVNSSIPNGDLRIDPLVVLGAVVSGVSFLGAGAIFFSDRHRSPRGLTTAASLLAAAAVGVACGIERYALAFFATTLYLIVLHLFKIAEQLLERGAAPNGAPEEP